MRRLVSRILLPMLLALACPASAATLTGSTCLVTPDNALALAAASCAGAGDATLLLDDQPGTLWRADGPGDSVLLTLQAPAQLTQVWVRNGHCASSSDYAYHGRPLAVTLTLTTSAGAVTAYRYLMEDTYDMQTLSDTWMSGYQLLPLPAPVDDVAFVQLTVDQTASGTGSAAVYVADMLLCGTAQSVQPAALQGLTIDNLSTRSGPSTSYTELGTYRVKGTYVRLYSIAYDQNGVGWVQAEVSYGGALRRVYTGLKRFDTSTFDLAALPEEAPLNRAAWVATASTPRYGPGTAYGSYGSGLTVEQGMQVTLLALENDYAQIQFSASNSGAGKEQRYRVWVKADTLRY